MGRRTGGSGYIRYRSGGGGSKFEGLGARGLWLFLG